MGYTKSISTIKWWYPHTKKLKYYLSAKFENYNNKFGKGWSPGSELMLGTNKYTFQKQTSKIILSSKMIYLKSILISHQQVLLLELYHNTMNIITCHIFTSQQIIAQGNNEFLEINRTNVWILIKAKMFQKLSQFNN